MPPTEATLSGLCIFGDRKVAWMIHDDHEMQVLQCSIQTDGAAYSRLNCILFTVFRW